MKKPAENDRPPPRRRRRYRQPYARDVLVDQRRRVLFLAAVLLAVLLAIALLTGEPVLILAGLALAVLGAAGFLVQWILRRFP